MPDFDDVRFRRCHVKPREPSPLPRSSREFLLLVASSPRPTSEPGMLFTQPSARLEGYAILSTVVFDDLYSVISPSIQNNLGNLQELNLQCCRMTFEDIVDDPTNIDKWRLLFFCRVCFFNHLRRKSRMILTSIGRRAFVSFLTKNRALFSMLHISLRRRLLTATLGAMLLLME